MIKNIKHEQDVKLKDSALIHKNRKVLKTY
jgi:hypothetical protein